jgi:hypothetical protein
MSKRARTTLVATASSLLALLLTLHLFFSGSRLCFFSGLGLSAILSLSAHLALRSGRRLKRVAFVAFQIALAALGVEGASLLMLRVSSWGPGRAGTIVGEDYRRPGRYFVRDPVLGYAPKPGASVSVRRVAGGTVVYSTTYHIDEYGLRQGPSVETPHATNVLFFGGSFVFGDGVEDEQTLSYRFQEKSGGKFAAHNFGFHGYGPQQMLATLEAERERRVLTDGPTRYAIYLAAMPGHIARVNGKTSWNVFDPRYQLADDHPGGVVNTGPFHGRWAGDFLSLLDRSATYSGFIAPALSSRSPPRYPDTEIFVRVVARARDIFEARYDGRFVVVYWTVGDAPNPEAASKLLTERGIDVIAIEDILPSYERERRRYHIDLERDLHPSALAYDQIADYLLRKCSR